MWFGLKLSNDNSRIEVLNNFNKEIGAIKWQDKYQVNLLFIFFYICKQEVVEKFKKTVAEKTKEPVPKSIGKSIVLENDNPIFTNQTINLYASHDSIL